MSAEEKDVVQALHDRNERLSETLREARDAMVEMKTHVDEEVKRSAVGESLDYVIVAIDMRLKALARSVGHATVGAEGVDDALRIPGSALPQIFERALLAHGYEIRPVSS
jgi:hypothetical protein